MSDIKQLEDLLRQARSDYYDGTPTLSDAEFDALEAELRELDPGNALLSQVGAKPTTAWPKAKHEIPMGSLDKAQNPDEFLAWASKIVNIHEPNLIITEKLDGASLELTYERGRLKRAITRGDGTTGEDITVNVRKMRNVKEKLPISFTGSLRGEAVLFRSAWRKHMADKKNPRNAAVGTMKRLDGEGCEHITVLYYDAIGDACGNKMGTYKGTIEFLTQGLMLHTPHILGPIAAKDIPTELDDWQERRAKLDYDIDGLVVRVNDHTLFQKLGDLNLNPKGAVAYKFPPEMKKTMVLDVTWQVGRTGRITPVAELQPVEIGGTTISRVSLHTPRMAFDMGAGRGATVLISRRNDVIPYVERVLERRNAVPPATCPACGETLEGWDGDYLTCKNQNCTAKLPSAIKVWVGRLGIKHWGDSFINTIVDANLVKSLPDLYDLDWIKVAGLVGKGVADRAKAELWSHVEMSFAEFVAALNIRHCDSTAKDLVADGIDTPELLVQANRTRLLQVPGVGEFKADAISDSVAHMRLMILKLATKVVLKQKATKGKLMGQSFCFTGAMERPRKELQDMAEAAGAEVKDSVSRGLTYLVMADPNSASSKAEKARKLGTKCISERDFLAMV